MSPTKQARVNMYDDGFKMTFQVHLGRMQNNIEIKNDLLPPVVPPPPPPPSLPPPPPSLPPQLKFNSKKSETILAEHQHRHISIEILNNIHYLFGDNKNVVSFYNPVHPVIQEGPCCGIVALSMASQFFNKIVSPSEILIAAKALNFTKSGEMFSAYNMAKLASSLISCEASVINNLSPYEILNHIADGWPVLIPYDADKNHVPCLNNGRNAHWAILCGICFSVSDEANLLLDTCNAIDKTSNIYNLTCKTLTKHLLNNAERVCIYAYQGKSKRLAAWQLDTLLESNKNLFEATKKYSHDDMIIPSNGLLELNDKAVLLKEKSQ
ncbi:UPF0692 protein C19orf54 homolog [Caerostris extrusa]|uniref:Actin maturation protease n=1 Tax=Caerostris extrusa TaxID=172846 RepID=A0AAV4SXK7_CAEEX|nr:UPF0692 protein C19orf54 homolog [Caerostris extrusa]